MKTIDKITFKADLVLERSITPTVEELGNHESTMELFDYEDGTYGIEWDVPSLDTTTHIGIWLDEDELPKKEVSDYDGVFDLLKEAISLLEKNGFNCEQVKTN